jgi:anti-sigma factor RsiW
METKSCTWARARLPLLAGGDGLGADRRPLERHLLLCAGCRRHLAALRASQDVLRAAASQPPARREAPSLWPALALQIREARRRRSSWPGDGVRAWAWPGLGLASGLLAALLVLGLTLDLRTPAPAVPTPSAATPALPAPVDPLPAVPGAGLETEESLLAGDYSPGARPDDGSAGDGADPAEADAAQVSR